ncbi:MAG: hypothetical protein JXB32_00465 [Deltaproteobacteria bacterium]|nr:hypothetical protein [Deltaproteobacteria bacterium]
MKKTAAKKRVRRSKVEELERKVALSTPAQKKPEMPSPYPPGTRYGLVSRRNLTRGEEG